MFPTWRAYLVIPIVAIFAVLLAACGGGSDNNSNSSPGPVGSPTPEATAAGNATGVANSPVPSQSGGNGANGTAVNVTEKDYSIAPSTKTAPSGKATFKINNQGPSTHEFVILKTDLPADQLPLNDSKTEVDEDANGINEVDEVEDVGPGESKELTVDLEPGRYVFICNITAHYGLGMHVDFTVQ
ncbi:MAG TPA: cupredoxin domain-containing protein [Dehalococcoidia bacterium]|jgi:uncharacterized cupredoxin-like copper-binding protein|nr:cupredoxin domain-containing protein [Dehalococcoidia bacterium]